MLPSRGLAPGALSLTIFMTQPLKTIEELKSDVNHALFALYVSAPKEIAEDLKKKVNELIARLEVRANP